MKEFFTLWVDAFNEWNSVKAPRMAAAVAFYTIFSMAPLLIVAVAVAGFVFGKETAQLQVTTQIGTLIGPGAAHAVLGIMQQTSHASSNVIATIIAVLLICWGSTQVLVELQDDLDTIWEVKQKPDQPIRGLLRPRLFSFLVVVLVGVLLLILLAASTVLSAVGNAASGVLPYSHAVLWIAENIISFCIVTLLFAAIYRILPSVMLRWRDVWVGSVVTAFLFTASKYLIGLYLGRASVGSAYGAAGSFVIVLIWVNFAAQIFFFGAEFGKTFALRHQFQIRPKGYAVKLAPTDKRIQGIAKPSQKKPDRAGSGPG